MRMSPRCRPCAFTLVELPVTAAAVVAAGSALLCVASAHRGDSHRARDARQATQVHRAMLGWSSQRGDASLPLPGLIRRNATTNGHRFELGTERMNLNNSANLYSALLADVLLDPDDLVSPVETNPIVQAMTGYNHLSYAPTAVDPTFWDPAFLTNIFRVPDGQPSSVSHASYAHLALVGGRKQRLWRPSADATVPLISNRGTYRGQESGINYARSFTLLFHPPFDAWSGHVVYGDNHVALESSFAPVGRASSCGGGAVDNIFRRDCALGADDDAWLCIGVGATTESQYTEAPERLVDGTIPQ
jgi:hypothetical protein